MKLLMLYTITNKMIKQILLILLCGPMVAVGQCIKGDCENGVGIYLWPDGSFTNGTWKYGSPHGIVQCIYYDKQGKLIKSFKGEMKMGLISGWGTETRYDTNGNLLGTYVGNFENGDYNGWGIWIVDDVKIEMG